MFILFVKQLCNHLAKIINAVGVSDFWDSVNHCLRNCHPNTPCNALINKQTTAIAASMAWLAYIIQNIHLPETAYVRHQTIKKTWGFLIDILGTNNFYLSWLLEVYGEIYGKNYDVGLLPESVTALALSLYLAILKSPTFFKTLLVW